MIVNVVKYLIIGVKEDIDKFFEHAQEMGFLEFISLTNKKYTEQPLPIQSLLSAIKILRKFPMEETYLGGGDLSFAMQICERIIELKEDLEKLSEEKRLLEGEIARVAPFGDFSIEDIEYIEREGDRKIQFFCKKAVKDPTHNEAIYITTEYGLDYFISISKQTLPHHGSHDGMIEMRIDAPLGELQNRESFVNDSLRRLEGELKDFAGHIEFLQETLREEMNKYNLTCAK